MDPLRSTIFETAPGTDVPPALFLRLCPPPHDVSPSALDRFAAGQASLKERKAVVRHILAGCTKCQSRLRMHWGIPGPPIAEGAYDLALDRSLERCLSRLQALAEK